MPVWPPRSHTWNLRFLYSTVSTLNPIAMCSKLLNGNSTSFKNVYLVRFAQHHQDGVCLTRESIKVSKLNEKWSLQFVHSMVVLPALSSPSASDSEFKAMRKYEIVRSINYRGQEKCQVPRIKILRSLLPNRELKIFENTNPIRSRGLYAYFSKRVVYFFFY